MIYHITNKSIAGFQIFNNQNEYERAIMALVFYQRNSVSYSLSEFIRKNKKANLVDLILALPQKNPLVEIMAYCIMPTHIHLILKEMKAEGISKYVNDILNSYTRYFNSRHKRKGPLWEGHTKKVLIETNEQLLHDTRYIHLNPVTAYIIDRPEDWLYSSYKEYLELVKLDKKICNYSSILNIDVNEYRAFVMDGISYQRDRSATN